MNTQLLFLSESERQQLSLTFDLADEIVDEQSSA